MSKLFHWIKRLFTPRRKSYRQTILDEHPVFYWSGDMTEEEEK